MSNPYAPPGDRPSQPRPAPDAGGQAPEGPSGPGRGQAPPPDGAGAGEPTSHRSPGGVPYERRAGAHGPAPHPTDVRRVAVLTRATAVLVLVSVLASMLPFPWYLAAVPVAVAAIAVGGRTLTLASRTRVRSASMGVVVLLIVVASLGLARPAQTVMMWDVERDFAACRGGALTVQAQNDCVSRYEKAIAARVQELSGRS